MVSFAPGSPTPLSDVQSPLFTSPMPKILRLIQSLHSFVCWSRLQNFLISRKIYFTALNSCSSVSNIAESFNIELNYIRCNAYVTLNLVGYFHPLLMA